MERYRVKLYPRAYRDIDEIYSYIAENLLAPAAAQDLRECLEDAILSLEIFPERGAVRRIGRYAHCGYRQLLVKRYVLIYRILPEEKEVHLVTVRYTASQF